MPENMCLPDLYFLAGKYRILETISTRGGTAITYKARIEDTGEIVAIKEFFPRGYCERGASNAVVPSEDEGKRLTFYQARDMFLREANLLKDNQSYGVVLKLYEVIELNDTIYYVMEYLDGTSLKKYLEEKGVLSLEETKQLLEPVFTSLTGLHRMNLIHRDVSPDNIFLCKSYEGVIGKGPVRLIDFGNARMMEKGKSHLVDWAKMGYAALEQQDESFRQGAWSDVYSLAATVYNCVTGREPVNAVKRAFDDTLAWPRELGVDIGLEQEKVLLKALSVLPEKRYQTVLEFYEDFYKKPVVLRPVLLGLDGQYINDEIPINGEMILGRKDICQVMFEKSTPGVSGVHCKVEYDAESKTLTLWDLNSTYGTRLLSGRKVAPNQKVVLKEGEGFIIGQNQIFAFALEE